MEQFCVDWARHRRVTVTSFQEKRSYDHGRTFESGFASLEPHTFGPATLGIVVPSIREDGMEDHDAVNIVSGSNTLHWECMRRHPHLPDPRLAMTVGLLLNLKKPGGCKVHCIHASGELVSGLTESQNDTASISCAQTLLNLREFITSRGT